MSLSSEALALATEAAQELKRRTDIIVGYLQDLYQRSGDLEGRIVALESKKDAAVFAVWAEEAARLDRDNNGFEWSFGNGDNTPANQGIVVPFESHLIALGLELGGGGGNARVGLWRSGTDSGAAVACDSGASAQVTYFLGDGPVFAAGDVLNFRTLSVSGRVNDGRVVAYLAIRNGLGGRL